MFLVTSPSTALAAGQSTTGFTPPLRVRNEAARVLQRRVTSGDWFTGATSTPVLSRRCSPTRWPYRLSIVVAAASGVGKSTARRKRKKQRSSQINTDVTQVGDPTEAKKALKALISEVPSGNGKFADEEQKSQIKAAVRKLEQYNSYDSPATTDAQVLNGEWRLLYSSMPGVPGGVFGPFAGEATQRLNVASQEMVNSVSFAGGASRLEWTTKWSALSGTDWTMPEEEWYPYLFGVKMELISLSFVDTESTWTMTYTDRDFRVFKSLRMGGAIDVFILQRMG